MNHMDKNKATTSAGWPTPKNEIYHAVQNNSHMTVRTKTARFSNSSSASKSYDVSDVEEVGRKHHQSALTFEGMSASATVKGAVLALSLATIALRCKGSSVF